MYDDPLFVSIMAVFSLCAVFTMHADAAIFRVAVAVFAINKGRQDDFEKLRTPKGLCTRAP
jgi:hypothetical protein